MITLKIKLIDGKIKWAEQNEILDMPNGFYYVKIEVLTEIKDTVTKTCPKLVKVKNGIGSSICMNTFEVKGKSNIRYCEEHRDKRKKK